MPKTIIISNRLPIKVQRTEDGLAYETSEGGLATGLGSIYKQDDNIWIGWPGTFFSDEAEQQQVAKDLAEQSMRPVFLTESEIRDFYEGFSNETLWPTFHYFSQYSVYDDTFWEAYQQVNRKFCKAVMEHAEPGDTIWVHDYQLLLLPALLRSEMLESTIGFFQHIPFPSYEIFRLLPWREQILQGMLGADLIGFHTYDDARHFLSSVSRIVGFNTSQGLIDNGHRSIMVDAFPMGIDEEKYATLAASEETKAKKQEYQEALQDQQIILSIDRLDYSKGIPQRLQAYELFLKENPEFHGKVTLFMLVVPSRDQVERYRQLKETIDELVGRINSSYRTITWNPIQYFYRSFPIEELSALYSMAHVALVTPMRDGMNLVCKEYIASKLDQKGVLVLSEMAGASRELADAVLINPNDMGQLVQALRQALTMPEEEQTTRMKNMQDTVRRYNIHHWVEIFMNRLDYIKLKQMSMATEYLSSEEREQLASSFRQAQQRLLFLDYDGTLTSFTKDPTQAFPDEELLATLECLTQDPKNRVVIVSGRDRNTLQKWLGHLPVDFIAEHGVWYRERSGEWDMFQNLSDAWKKEVRPVLELHVSRTPGSFIEEKDFSLVWHYRRVDPTLAELRARELSNYLLFIAANINLQVMEGDKIVEVKNVEVNKGIGTTRWLEQHPHDFILCIGDDRTDEDMFRVMPEEAFTIKVGSERSLARFNLDNSKQVRKLLKSLCS
ncbi:bifunctional alpha,alpha-trehalose-phosphate synthase (UDP-forming)/trehalose-phosphatase [Rufibacter glacialis]|uniref:Alpha,alpha-trehalose-phosphate synthase n=1 Tax=Rufibacter glacialis TaxID=1259555 RepID=A0A5M8QKY8_9BACT|nr:bifunctional alpha,alpha-trehalose-phosphate synthase (UDP-forming)/trehalose-phosphatase [Rufibacter glacialis]KAA6435426.1 bifunctional alpha,alpha-trehalose-phosphate synthase (UDP-forming)/trehalose-phosphatase [Rufibacter glacialis]GGK63343.1 bifunctional alpha,alpha-trehalose-phosphate synthase (UDP-forming)/trehalose-phosphatase [Rufibacter glacialis]